MILQIALLALVTKAAVAWPITPLDGYSRTNTHDIPLSCGDDKEFKDHTFTNLNITFVGFDANGNIPAGCKIKFRVAVQDLNLQKFGIQVTGSVDISSGNNPHCASSYLSLADEDDLNDELGSIEKYCDENEDLISFKTTEDILVIEFVVGQNGASGNGFNLMVAPHYLCGGMLELEDTITSPDYPSPYPRDITCLWRIQAPEGHHISLKCKNFGLKPPKKNKCADYLMVMAGSKHDQFCGTSLHKKPEITYPSNTMILDFRTNKKMNSYTGFSCKTKFISQTKNLLMAKFFK